MIFESIFVGCNGYRYIYKQSNDYRKNVNNYIIFQLWGYFCSFQRVWFQPVILVSPLLILWMQFLLKCFVIYVYLYPPIKIPCTVTLVVNSFYKFVDTCRDNYDDCKSLGKATCENPTVFTWVFHNCALTCDFCSEFTQFYLWIRMFDSLNFFKLKWAFLIKICSSSIVIVGVNCKVLIFLYRIWHKASKGEKVSSFLKKRTKSYLKRSFYINFFFFYHLISFLNPFVQKGWNMCKSIHRYSVNIDSSYFSNNKFPRYM